MPSSGYYFIKLDIHKTYLSPLRGRYTRMCCLRLTHVRHRQNAFRQSEYNSLNLGFRVKTPITKLKDNNIPEGKTVRFFNYSQY